MHSAKMLCSVLKYQGKKLKLDHTPQLMDCSNR